MAETRKKKEKLHKTGFYIDAKLWYEFKSLCAKEGRKMSDVINEELEKWINEHSKEITEIIGKEGAKSE